ncbi:hypothetical protein DBV39_02950 [Orrella marina]|uniref:prephenate dehydratase n=1 Tax=Orrella marina TaxID=2163011 RepID=A0A2R4XGK6_9BURK|nr:hypothetical protein DBV39_02950 [Orrella marina]
MGLFHQRSSVFPESYFERRTVHELVGYLGLPGSWTHQVTRDLFGEHSKLQGFDAPELLKAYSQGEISWICVPYYSSIAGTTPYLAQLLALQRLWIEQDVVRPVQHSLAAVDPGVKLSGVTHITGHPVALEEVRPWLSDQFPDAEWVFAKSGSDAAHSVAQKNHAKHLAVAPPQAVGTHGLHTLVADIPTVAPNVTRWWVLGPQVPQTPNPGRWVWLKVAGANREALCALERALPVKDIEPALWVHAPSSELEVTHWLVACLRSDDLYAFLVLVSVHGLSGTLMGAHDDAIANMVSSVPASTSACLSLSQADRVSGARVQV